jgi:hypothetical protein
MSVSPAKLRPSSKRNPCPVCGRTKDGDCRISDEIVLCHNNLGHRPGQVFDVDGKRWAYTGAAEDGRCGVFKPDRPLVRPMVPGYRIGEAKPARTWNDHLIIYSYGPSQRTIRHPATAESSKYFQPQHVINSQWLIGAGPLPWNFYGSLPSKGESVIEVEGEKCCEIVLAAGAACITHPGHDLTHEACVRRYQGIASLVGGVIYIADNDPEGARKAEKCRHAAQVAGIDNFLILEANNLWPDLPKGGSVDDAPEDQIISAITTAAANPPRLHLTEELAAEGARSELRDLIFNDGLSGSRLRVEQAKIAASYQMSEYSINAIVKDLLDEVDNQQQATLSVAIVREENAAFEFRKNHLTLDYIMPEPLVEPLRFISESLQSDDLAAAMIYMTAVSACVRTGTLIRGDKRSFLVPPNIYLAIVGRSGLGKTPIFKAFGTIPLVTVDQHYEALNRQRYMEWEIKNRPLKRVDQEPPPIPYLINLGNYTGERLSIQLAEHEKDRLGLLIAADELKSIFSSLDQYKPGGKGTEEQQLLSLFDGTGEVTIRMGGTRRFRHAQFSILGGIQPKVLDQISVHGDPSGLFARILLLPLLEDFTPRDPVESDEVIVKHAEHEKTLQDYAMRVHGLGTGHYVLSDQAMRLLASYAHDAKMLGLNAPIDAQGAVYGKRAAYIMRIAGLLHMLNIVCGLKDVKDRIEDALIEKAYTIVDHLQGYALRSHSRSAHSAAGFDPEFSKVLLKAGRKEGGITAAQFRNGYCRTGNAKTAKLTNEAIEAYMHQLQEAGYGEMLKAGRSYKFRTTDGGPESVIQSVGSTNKP